VTVEAGDDENGTFDTIYFGLGQAYRVSRTGEQAWVGRLVDGKFQFITADDQAEEIRKLIAVYKGEEDPAMIAVPTQVN
jgi:hypothetical protein